MEEADMRIQTLLWTGLAVVSMGALLASLPQTAYGEEIHGNNRYTHEVRGDTDHDNGGTDFHHSDTGTLKPENPKFGTLPVDGTSHTGVVGFNRNDSKHEGGIVVTDHDDISRHHDETTVHRDNVAHERDYGTIEHHTFGGDNDRGDHEVIYEDRDDYYGYHPYGFGGVPVLIWGTNGYRSRLGRVWYEQEGPYDGVWTRRGNSNVFDAVWTWGSNRVTSVLTINIVGNRVTVYRHRGSDGHEFTYRGTLSGNGTAVHGTVTGGPGVVSPFSATISR
jgi:hypothetical protein